MPGPGGLVLRKTGKVKRASKTAAAAGAVKLTVKARGRARERLDDAGEVKVRAKVTFTPTGGTAKTKAKKIKLIKR